MKLNSQQVTEMAEAAAPLLQWLRDNNAHSMVEVRVDTDGVNVFELLAGIQHSAVGKVPGKDKEFDPRATALGTVHSEATFLWDLPTGQVTATDTGGSTVTVLRVHRTWAANIDELGMAITRALNNKTSVPLCDPALEPYAVFLPRILAEVKKATAKFPEWPTDPVHAAAIVVEEAGELQKAVTESVYEPGKHSYANVPTEAIQTASMCLRFLASLSRYAWQPAMQHKQGA